MPNSFDSCLDRASAIHSTRDSARRHWLAATVFAIDLLYAHIKTPVCLPV
jgi:hypothetical protein